MEAACQEAEELAKYKRDLEPLVEGNKSNDDAEGPQTFVTGFLHLKGSNVRWLKIDTFYLKKLKEIIFCTRILQTQRLILRTIL